MKNRKLKIMLNFFITYNYLCAKTQIKEINQNKKNESSKDPLTKESKKEVETGEGGVSYYEKSKRKAKEPHKNTKARGPMDPSNRQGEGLQNVNGSRE
jgi:hypothetical protein